MTFVSDLEPKELWRHFDEILTIPRGSKNEKQMGEYVIGVAKKNGLTYKQDDEGNIVVTKPGKSGHENAAVTILQSHLDMVNDKNADVEHDFSTDPIKPRREGDYLYATGTTLGSDNGIGVAAALALMDSDSVQHGPLELLFTTDEETGLTGAGSLQSDFLQGRQLINMDTEEEGSLYVGCAGGAGVNINVKLAFSDVKSGDVAIAVKLQGLNGGHSGVDVHLQRGNAIRLLTRVLVSVNENISFSLASLTGGNMHNAIPREAFATILVSDSERPAFEKAMHDQVAGILAEFKPVDPNIKLVLTQIDADKVMTPAVGSTVLNLLNALPHGVMAMSYDIPELVETSSNLAIVKIENDNMLIHISNRSSVDTAIQAIQERVMSMGRLAGAEVEELEGYPGWKPNLDSHILKVAEKAHGEILGKEPSVKAIHAGLECGIIGEKFPGMDMVSLGPQIEFPHSPDERIRVGSVADFYKLLTGVLERLA